MPFISIKSTPTYKSLVTSNSWNTASSISSFSNYPQYKSLEYYPESICVAGSSYWYLGIGGSAFQFFITSGVESYDVSNIQSSVSYVTLGNALVPYPYNHSIDIASNGTRGIIAYGSIVSPPVVTSFNFDSSYNLAFVSRPAGGNSWAILDIAKNAVYVNNTANMIFTSNSTHVHKYVANAYNLASATYDSSIPVGTTTTNDLFLSDDGSKLYTIGSGNDRIYQYNLSTNWNLSTAVLYGSYNVAGIDSNPTGVCISADGLYAYFLGRTNNRIYRLELSSAYDITTSSYSSNYLSLGSSTGLETGVRLKPGGSNIYYNSGSAIIEVSMPTPYSLIGASKSGAYTSTSRRSRFTYGLSFSSDGYHAYTGVDKNLDKINISTAWDLSTGKFQEVDESLITLSNTRVTGSSSLSARYGNSGKFLYIFGSYGTLQYDLGTAYNIGTATYNTKTSVGMSGNDFSISANRLLTYDGATVRSYIMPQSWNVASLVSDSGNNKTLTGSCMYVPTGDALLLCNSASIAKYTMSNSYVPSSASYINTKPGWFSDATNVFDVKSLQFSADGSSLYYLSLNNVRKYSLSNAWDIESSVYVGSYNLGAEYTTLRFGYDGVNMFVGSDSNIRHLYLSAPYDFSSFTSSGVLTVPNKSFYLNKQGNFLYSLNNGIVSEYYLSTRWNVLSATSTGNSIVLPNSSSSSDIVLSDTGQYLYHITANTSSNKNTIQKFEMSSPWNISTATFRSSYVVKGINRSIDGLFFRPYGNEYYISDIKDKSIYNLTV